MTTIDDTVWVVDFGSQYTQLIVRKTRELGFAAKVLTYEDAIARFANNQKPQALVLSGGPASVVEECTDYSAFFDDENLPVLGVCYGMQLMANYFGGTVEKGKIGEYGLARVKFEKEYETFPQEITAWMSHFDHITQVPENFFVCAKSDNDLIAAMQHRTRLLFAVQFHPEVDHTEHGTDILTHFYKEIAHLTRNWTSTTMLLQTASALQKIDAGDILCAFSGGVDSFVAATITEKVFPGRVHCFFVDNGLLRPQDHVHIADLQKETTLNIEIVDAGELFLKKLEGISEPEQKRKIIGNTFIEVFEKKVTGYKKEHGITFTHLLQGTLYPDVIESLSPHKKNGKSVTIKSHHNVGGLPEKMNLQLMEPFRLLFKDEVRLIGKESGLPKAWVARHPFPGPGIGVRILGEITPGAIRSVQESDQILFEELHIQDVYHDTWQAFTVFLPVQTVGIKGDERVYENVICLRLVNSSDGMTAEWSRMPYSFLEKVSARITNEVSGITRVVYDITNKPPGTIEWE